MQYKKVRRPLPEIARELGVDGIVEGAVARSQERVRVSAQLVYAATDAHLWAESYDRPVGDVLYLQRELAQSIAERVKGASSLSAFSGNHAHARLTRGRETLIFGEDSIGFRIVMRRAASSLRKPSN